MKFILTKIPVVEDVLVTDIRLYLKELRFGEQYPNHKNVAVSNDHPFELLLNNEGSAPDLFPSLTIVSSNDSEVPGMAKGWSTSVLDNGDIDDINPQEWFMSDTGKADLIAALVAKNKIYGIQHQTTWRDSTSIEIWTENIQVKNDIYNMIMAYLTGPKVIGLHQDHGFVIHSNTIQGQRSGYYNYDFGRTLYGARISLSVDYQIVQAVYDEDISTLAELEHSYREVIHG